MDRKNLEAIEVRRFQKEHGGTGAAVLEDAGGLGHGDVGVEELEVTVSLGHACREKMDPISRLPHLRFVNSMRKFVYSLSNERGS